MVVGVMVEVGCFLLRIGSGEVGGERRGSDVDVDIVLSIMGRRRSSSRAE